MKVSLITVLMLGLVSSLWAETVIELESQTELEEKFIQTGKANASKFAFQSDAGIDGSGGLKLGDTGYGGQWITISPVTLDEGTASVFSVDFKAVSATRDNGSPIYIGIAGLPSYDVSFASTENPDDNHVLVSLLRSGEVPGQSVKLFLQNKEAGQAVNTGYVYTTLESGSWYRLELSVSKAGGSVTGRLLELSDSGEAGKVLAEHMETGITNPALGTGQAYFFFGGQGKSVSRGVEAIDRIILPEQSDDTTSYR